MVCLKLDFLSVVPKSTAPPQLTKFGYSGYIQATILALWYAIGTLLVGI
jgi:hypothetical protein